MPLYRKLLYLLPFGMFCAGILSLVLGFAVGSFYVAGGEDYLFLLSVSLIVTGSASIAYFRPTR